jgi:hypothetical protein
MARQVNLKRRVGAHTVAMLHRVPTRTAPGFPQYRHGSIRLTGLFNKPSIVE